MTVQDLLNRGYNDFVTFGDDYDGCLIGMTTENQAVYSYDKMIQWLKDNWKLSEEDAIEHIHFNTLGSLPYQKGAPIIMYEETDDSTKQMERK